MCETVAVVVPSPALSLVFDGDLFTICAPMFSNRSSSSISLATVTPSFVMRGAPKDFSMTTLRPFGPGVTFTALLRIFHATQHAIAGVMRKLERLSRPSILTPLQT